MPSKTERHSKLFGFILYFFAVYTVAIKYVHPVVVAVIENVPLTTYILFWDAWWIAHIFVGTGLIKCKTGTWRWALILCIAEIIIIGVKMGLFIADPAMDIWHINWLVNKSFLFVYFWILIVWLFRKEVRQLL